MSLRVSWRSLEESKASHATSRDPACPEIPAHSGHTRKAGLLVLSLVQEPWGPGHRNDKNLLFLNRKHLLGGEEDQAQEDSMAQVLLSLKRQGDMGELHTTHRQGMYALTVIHS